MINVVVYRIEHIETGKGFYNSNIIKLNDSDELDYIKSKHCQLFEDITLVCKNFTNGTHFCAFVNINALKYAMTYEELELLINLGFNVLKLTLKDALIANDGLQVAYDKNDIIKVENINNKIDNLYN